MWAWTLHLRWSCLVWHVASNVYTQPFRHVRVMIQGQFLYGVEFSFSWAGCLNSAKEVSPPYCLLIASGRLDGFMPFSRDSSWIWTRPTDSISYVRDCYAKSAASNDTCMILGISVILYHLFRRIFFYLIFYTNILLSPNLYMIKEQSGLEIIIMNNQAL